MRASALEAGISEQFLSAALGDLGFTPGIAAATGGGALVPVESLSSRAGIVAGAPMELRFEAKVPGEASGRDYDLLVEVIRRQLGDVGVVSTVGRSLAWTSTNVKRRVGVTVAPRGGFTTIRVEERMGPLAGQYFGGIVGGGGGGFGGGSMGVVLAATHSVAIMAATVLGIVASCYGLARTLFTRAVRSRGEELRELTTRLAEAVAESMGPTRR